MNIEIIPLILLALLSSFSHCISMCGGFVFSYTTVKIDKSKSLKYQSMMHLLYGLGRTTTYIFLGFVFGSLGYIMFASPLYKGILMIILGILMAILGISAVNNIKLPTIDVLNIQFFKTLHLKTFKSKTPISFFIFGILNGLIPCGLVYFFIAKAITTGSMINSMIYMGIFGLSTIPALFFLGISSSFLGTKYKKIFSYISSFLIMGYGLLAMIKGALILKGM
jgi:sulfite exporter TauE/SafE